MNFDNKFYGIGNRVSLDDYATYTTQSYFITPQLGIVLGGPLKAFVSYSHRQERLKNFVDPSQKFTPYWQKLTSTDLTEKQSGLWLPP